MKKLYLIVGLGRSSSKCQLCLYLLCCAVLCCAVPRQQHVDAAAPLPAAAPSGQTTSAEVQQVSAAIAKVLKIEKTKVSTSMS